MEKQISVVLVAVLVLVSLAGCGGSNQVDVDATIQAGIQIGQLPDLNTSLDRCKIHCLPFVDSHIQLCGMDLK